VAPGVWPLERLSQAVEPGIELLPVLRICQHERIEPPHLRRYSKRLRHINNAIVNPMPARRAIRIGVGGQPV